MKSNYEIQCILKGWLDEIKKDMEDDLSSNWIYVGIHNSKGVMDEDSYALTHLFETKEMRSMLGRHGEVYINLEALCKVYKVLEDDIEAKMKATIRRVLYHELQHVYQYEYLINQSDYGEDLITNISTNKSLSTELNQMMEDKAIESEDRLEINMNMGYIDEFLLNHYKILKEV